MGKIKSHIKAGVRRFLPGNDPSFIIIGAQKAGTSALHYYLNQHPNLVGSNPKELHFFEHDLSLIDKDLHWYRSRFKSINFLSNKLFFEASPNYLYHERAAINIRRYYPTIKLIVVLRDPVSRAYSAWNMYRSFFARGNALRQLSKGMHSDTAENPIYSYYYKGRKIFPSFAEAVSIEERLIEEKGPREPAILRRGLYYDQISIYLKHFHPDQLLIVGYKDLLQHPAVVCENVFRFLDLNGNANFRPLIAPRNRIEYLSSLSPTDRSKLDEFYKQPNEQLMDFLGYRINW